MDRQTKNAAQITRQIKAHLRVAGLPDLKVSTRYARLAARSPQGRMFAWQTFVHELGPDLGPAVEILLDNVPGRIDVKWYERGSFVSIVTEDQ